jgi:hypothetical protein
VECKAFLSGLAMTGNGIFVTTSENPLPILEDRLGTLEKATYINQKRYNFREKV